MVGKPASTFCGSFGQNSCTCLVPNHNIHAAASIILAHISHPGSQHEQHCLTKNATPCDTYSSYSWLDRSKLFRIFAFGPSLPKACRKHFRLIPGSIPYWTEGFLSFNTPSFNTMFQKNLTPPICSLNLANEIFRFHFSSLCWGEKCSKYFDEIVAWWFFDLFLPWWKTYHRLIPMKQRVTFDRY